MIIYVVVICVVVLQGVDAVCAPSRINCRSNNSYTFCVDLGYTTVKLESVDLKCPDGLFCSEKHYYPCVPESEVPPIGLPEPDTTTAPVTITTTQTDNSPTGTYETLIPPSQSQSTTELIYTTPTVTPPISTPNPPSQSPTTITPTPTLTTIAIINSTTAVPPITNSTLIPSTQSESTTSIGDNQTTIVTTTTAPVVTASSPVLTTQVPTLPPCPNPPPGKKPACQRSGTTSPGPICTMFFECVPIWLRLEAEERICEKGRAYSASQRKCVIPPVGCICAN